MPEKTDVTKKWHPEQEIPAIHELLDRAGREPDLSRLHPYVLKQIARAFADWWRGRIPTLPEAPDRAEVLEKFPDYARGFIRPVFRPVINATGVILHTNLGRAPLPPRVWARMRPIACGYTNLEYELEEGERGTRDRLVAAHLALLTGAEDAVIVNNNAAAVLLILAALAAGREVLVSRGELIEIGGKFRLPEVFEQSGTRLVEVGTTNRTRLDDYIRAAGDQTAAILRTHPSNYRLIGFTERPKLTELTRWAHARGLQVWKDLGSGLLDQADLAETLPGEPTVRDSLLRGCDLVCFSGDKILGGPQAGVIAGRSEPCARLRSHPLYRALRVDKLTLAALDLVLGLYMRADTVNAVRPRRLLTRSPDRIRSRAVRLIQKLADCVSSRYQLSAVPDHAYVGGGLAPDVRLDSWAVVIRGGEPEALHRAFRTGSPPVVGRVEKDQLWLNLHTVLPGQYGVLFRRMREVLGTSSPAGETA